MKAMMESDFVSVENGYDLDAQQQEHVAHCIHDRLSGCSYSFYFNKIDWTFDHGRLTLRGCVPSYYMKQVLQTLLRNIEDVRQIVNDVDVISSTGLSSVRP